MLLFHQLGEELQEEGHQQKTNVHTVHIGIGRDNHLVVAEVLETVFDIESVLQQVEFFVFVHHLLGHAEAVQRLTAQAEHGLRLHVAGLGNGTRSRVTFGNEDHGFAVQRVLRVGQVNLAVAELAVVQVRLFRAVVRELLDACDFLAFAFVLRNAV